MIYASLGTVSEGTVNPSDLIPAFAGELKSLFRKQSPRWKRGNTRRIKGLLKQAENWQHGDYKPGTCDSCGETCPVQLGGDSRMGFARECSECWGSVILPELENELRLFSPPYASFGTNAGDGADFGFYPDMESLNEDIRAGEVLSQNEGENRLHKATQCPVPKNYTGFFAHTSDHGNLSLYQFTRGKQRYIWGVV